MTTAPPHTSRAIIVAGMHRSGTSAVTRMINILGAKIPSKLLLPDLSNAGETNELGFWEGEEIVALNEEFLNSVDSSWNDTAFISEASLNSDVSNLFVARMEEYLRSEFGSSPLFALKDPRMARTMPLWLKALERIGAKPSFVLPIRHPLEVYASLRKRNGMGRGQSLLLWLRFTADAERFSRGYDRSIISYEGVVTDWRSVAKKIAADCHFDWPRMTQQAEMEIDYFVDAGRRHNVAGEDSVDSLPEQVRDLYSILRTASRTGEFDERSADAIYHNLNAADSLYNGLVREFNHGMQDHAARADRVTAELAIATTNTAAGEESETELARLQSALAELQEAVSAKAVVESQLDGFRRNYDEERVELLSSLERAQAEHADLTRKISALTDDLDSEVVRRSGLSAELSDAIAERLALREKTELLEIELNGAQNEVAALRADAERFLTELAKSRRSASQTSALSADLVVLRTREAALIEERQRTAARLEALLNERAELEASNAALKIKTQSLDQVSSDLHAQTERSQQLEESLTAAGNAKDALQRKFEKRAASLAEAKAEKAKLAAQVERGDAEGIAMRRQVDVLQAEIAALSNSRALRAARYLRQPREIAALLRRRAANIASKVLGGAGGR